MKKVILVITTLLFLINFNNVYAKGYCIYEYDGAILTVYEEGNGSISQKLNTDNAATETNLLIEIPGEENLKKVHSYLADIKPSSFYSNNEFSCPDLQIYKLAGTTTPFILEETTVYFTDDTTRPTQNVNTTYYETLSGAFGNSDNYCDLTYTDSKINVKVRVSAKNGKLQFENIIKNNISLGSSLGTAIHTGLLEEYFLDANGQLDCGIASSAGLKMLIGKDEKWSLANGYGGYLYGPKMTEDDAKNGMYLQTGYQYKDYYSVNIQVNAKDSGNTDIDIDIDQGEMDCDGLLAGQTGLFLQNTLDFIKFLVPIIIIVFTIIDFVKAVASQDDKEVKKASNKLLKRIIIGIVIFLLPSLLKYALKIADIPYGTCTLK